MYLQNKNILIISPEPWNFIYVSKHHYASVLAGKNNVYFLNPPTSIKKIVISTVPGKANLHIIDYPVLVRGQRFLPAFLNRYLDRFIYKRFEKAAGCQFEVVWNFENSRFYDFSFLKGNILKIYHQVDLNQNFHPQLAAKTADFVFAVNDSIKDFLSKFNKVYKVPHGFSGYFSDRALSILSCNSHCLKSPSVIQVYYVGNLNSKYLDNELLLTLIRMNKDVEFNIVGPIDMNSNFYEELESIVNVKMIGKVSSSEVMEYLDKADILLQLYRYNDFPKQLTSSHKTLEYLASGKVTVSSYMDEYEDQGDILLMGKSRLEIINLFEFAKKNLNELNSIDKMSKRVKFASKHTYNNLIKDIDFILSSNLGI